MECVRRPLPQFTNIYAGRGVIGITRVPFQVGRKRHPLVRRHARRHRLDDIFITAVFGCLGYAFMRLELDAAPLMLGNDPRHMSAATKRLLTAPGLLAINQDPLGKQAERVHREGEIAIWRKELASGRQPGLHLNLSRRPASRSR